MVTQSAGQHNSLTRSQLAVWNYLSDLWVRHLADPRAGVRPRINTISQTIGYTRRTIFRALAVLEDAGILRRHHRERANGEQASSLYVLHHLYRRPVRQHVQDEPPAVQNPRSNQRQRTHDETSSNVDNFGPNVDNSQSHPADAQANVTPLEHSPMGEYLFPEKYLYEKDIARGSARRKSIPIHWNRDLDDAYDQRIYRPYRPDTARFLLTLQNTEAFVYSLTSAIPDHLDVGDVLEHIVERLADLALDDTTVVEKPPAWIASYIRKLCSQGQIVKGRKR